MLDWVYRPALISGRRKSVDSEGDGLYVCVGVPFHTMRCSGRDYPRRTVRDVCDVRICTAGEQAHCSTHRAVNIRRTSFKSRYPCQRAFPAFSFRHKHDTHRERRPGIQRHERGDGYLVDNRSSSAEKRTRITRSSQRHVILVTIPGDSRENSTKVS